MNQRLKMLRQLIAAIIVITAIVGLSSCEKYTYMPEVINPDETIHFGATIQPIFNDKCISCHTGGALPDLREGHSYQTLSDDGLITPPGESSGLYLKMKSSSHNSRSNDADKENVRIWIDQGALNN
jgi:hypothetical protein